MCEFGAGVNAWERDGMFGYVKPQNSELLVREYDFYRAVYCGICRSMKKHTGCLSNVTLSYDSVFLALVRMLYLEDSEFSSGMYRCIAHPMKKRCMLNENAATEYTARAFAILTYYKLADDISDERGAKRFAVGLTRPILSSAKSKANLPALAETVRKKLLEITEHERAKTVSIDAPATCFGELLGEVFAEGLDESDRRVPYAVGYHLGKFIYCADAAEDYEKDRQSGSYNPYVLGYGAQPLTDQNRETIKCAILLECKKLEAAVNLLPFGNRRTIESIINNIIYLGITKRLEFLNPKDEGDKSSDTAKKQGELT